VCVPTPADVWELITRGNADALGFGDGGRLEQDAAADLLVLKPPFAVDRHLVGRLIYTWHDDFIAHRVVNGRLI
jgi:cytosine/adenosine deaminase-related metal-dependent hydrolase